MTGVQTCALPIYPMISGRVDKRLRKKAEAEKNSPEAYDKEMDAWFGTSC